jgi:predicted RNase H-like HicB family nuclease
MKYSVVLHKDPQSDYSVTVPDLPGCFSAGSTIEEALAMAKEAIECHIEGMLLDGESIPKLRPFEERQANPDYATGIWGIVEIDISQLSPKSKRINITLPEHLLKTVEHYAQKHGETRSGLLAHAVTEYISSHQ